jgi:hypothetical protein
MEDEYDNTRMVAECGRGGPTYFLLELGAHAVTV